MSKLYDKSQGTYEEAALVAKLFSDVDRCNACIIAVHLIDKWSHIRMDDDRYSCHILLCFQPVEQIYIDCCNFDCFSLFFCSALLRVAI